MDAGSQIYSIAEKSFPGMTAAELSSVRVIFNYPASVGFLHPPGYLSAISSPWVKDGSVAVLCGPKGTLYEAMSVTFVGP